MNMIYDYENVVLLENKFLDSNNESRRLMLYLCSILLLVYCVL